MDGKVIGIIAAFVALLVLLVTLVFFIDRAGAPGPEKELDIGAFFSYGDSVYYFEGTKDFGPQLAAFIKEHPELRVVALAPLDNVGYGATRGYWVVMEKAAK